MELIPRISRAQSMDVLSSQANLAGYKAVIDAAENFVCFLENDSENAIKYLFDSFFNSVFIFFCVIKIVVY